MFFVTVGPWHIAFCISPHGNKHTHTFYLFPLIHKFARCSLWVWRTKIEVEIEMIHRDTCKRERKTAHFHVCCMVCDFSSCAQRPHKKNNIHPFAENITRKSYVSKKKLYNKIFSLYLALFLWHKHTERECVQCLFYPMKYMYKNFRMENVIAIFFFFRTTIKWQNSQRTWPPFPCVAQSQSMYSCVSLLKKKKKEPYSRSIDRETAKHTENNCFVRHLVSVCWNRSLVWTLWRGEYEEK